jgi:hypothetical protein
MLLGLIHHGEHREHGDGEEVFFRSAQAGHFS